MRVVPAGWQGAVLVCGKCSKKVGAGFGDKGRTPLVKALRKLLGLKKSRKSSAGVVEVKCLGLCPKRAVVAIDTARPGEWRLVVPGTPVEEVAVALGLISRATDSVTPDLIRGPPSGELFGFGERTAVGPGSSPG